MEACSPPRAENAPSPIFPSFFLLFGSGRRRFWNGELPSCLKPHRPRRTPFGSTFCPLPPPGVAFRQLARNTGGPIPEYRAFLFFQERMPPTHIMGFSHHRRSSRVLQG